MNMLRESSRSDARAAIITTLSVALGIALLPAGSYLAYVVVWFGVATAAALSGIAPLTLARRGAIALPFILAALPLLFTRSDELLWSGTVGPANLSVSGAGLRVQQSSAPWPRQSWRWPSAATRSISPFWAGEISDCEMRR